MKISINYSIFGLMFFLVSNLAYAIDKEKKEYIDESSNAIIDSLCSKKGLDNKFKISGKMCIDTLNTHAKECTPLIEPLIPSFDTDEDREKIGTILNNVWVLYTMCLKSHYYEDKQQS